LKISTASDIAHVQIESSSPPLLPQSAAYPNIIFMLKLLLSALLLIGVVYSCTTTVEPDATIPTVSYLKDIAPIIAANCAQPGCHGAERTEKFNLLSYSELSRLVTPNKPHNSELYNVIRLYEGGVMPPQPNDPLTDFQIAQIYVWILQGASDN